MLNLQIFIQEYPSTVGTRNKAKSWSAQNRSLLRVLSLLRVPTILRMEHRLALKNVLLRGFFLLLLRVPTVH